MYSSSAAYLETLFMGKVSLLVSSLSALLFIAAFISKPTPDDIVTHALAKCSKPEEKAMFALGLAFLFPKSSQHSSLNPLAAVITSETKGRIVFHEGRFSSWVTLEGATIAYAALGVYKIPTCKQLRSFK